MTPDLIHPSADGNRCLVCARTVPSEFTSAHGIVGLRYTETGEQVVSCDDHLEQLRTLWQKIKGTRGTAPANPALLTP